MMDSDTATSSTLLRVAIGDSAMDELLKGPITLEFQTPTPITLALTLTDSVRLRVDNGKASADADNSRGDLRG